MKKIVLTYGVVSGVVIIGSILLTLSLGSGDSSNMAALEWLGYLVMIVAFSVIFVGIKRYRDLELGGVIRFRTAFLVGLGITAIASVIYVGAWEVYLATSDYDFIGEYTESKIAAAEAAGASEAKLSELTAQMEQMKQGYANPLFRMPITFLEIFPVGLLVSLIAASVLRKSEVLPAEDGMVSSAT